MGYFPVWYNSRVVIYERKMFLRSATGNIKQTFKAKCDVINFGQIQLIN